MRKGRTTPWGPGILFIQLFLCIEILNASVKISQTEMNMFTASTTPAVRLFASASVDQLQTDVATLSQTLDTYITNAQTLHNDIQIVLVGLNTINTLATDLKALDDALTTVEKGIKYAQDIPDPQVVEKADKLEKKMKEIHPPVTTASTKVNNFNDKVTPTRIKLQSFDDKLQKFITTATNFKKGLNTYAGDLKKAQQCISSLPDGSTKDNLQSRLDKLADASDTRVVEANKILAGIIKMVDDGDKIINKEIKKLLKPFSDLETDVAKLLKSLKDIIGPLKRLEDLFGQELCIKIPKPLSKKDYDICIGCDIILQGADKIESEIKKKVGKVVWEALKIFGVEKAVKKLVDLGDEALKPILKDLHLDIDLTLPGLNDLDQNLKDLSIGLGDLSNMLTLDTQPIEDAFGKIEKDFLEMENIYQNCKP